MEVPILGSDSLKWLEFPVPSSSSNAASDTCAPLTHDCASSIAIGDPPAYLIYRIHKHLPHALELFELCPDKEFPKLGLRITFPQALSSSVFLCKNEIDVGSRSHPYLLYALTVAGVAYLLRLGTVSNYASSSVVREISLHPHGPIASAAATTTGCLVVGRNDGSLACFQLTLESNAPGFLQELRDDPGIGSLWGFMSRGRTVGAVQDLAISMVRGKPLIFAIYTDGMLRVWDLSSHLRLFSHKLNGPTMAGAALVRLWIGQADNDSSTIPLAMLYRDNSEICSEAIHVYSLHCNVAERIALLMDPSEQVIPIEDGWIDVKLVSNKICILKNNGLMLHELHKNVSMVDAVCYALQEDFVADQLFQSSEHSSDDLFVITHSILSSSKDHILPIVSSIILRRLLLPGIHHNAALRTTLLDYNRHWTESDFHSLTADGLKKEILSLIEHEGLTGNSSSIFCCWKIFCARYFQNWCKSNGPCGLLVDSSTDTVGLIRKSSVSSFRSLEDIERVNDGSLDELGNFPSFGLDSSDEALDCDLLAEMLRCVIYVNQQLGKTASAIFYELLISAPPVISSEEIIPRLLKILETGYSSTASMLHISGLGPDVAWEKKLADHKNLRKFSIDMMLSLHALHKKSGSWSHILSVIENYLKYLIPQKMIQKYDAEVVLDINAAILVQATSQVAKVMLESALDIHLFLSYLVSISGQINMLHDDISKIQLELIPMIQEIIYEWLLLHFFATTPSESAAIEDFSSQLSLLQIDSNKGRRSWNEKLGKCEFTLAFIFLLNVRSSSREQSHYDLRSIPNVQDIVDSVREFASWTMLGQNGESLTLLRRAADLAFILLRHGQYDAVEHLLTIVEAHLLKEKTSHGIQATDGGWCILHHLLGCCFLAQAHRGLHGVLKERKVHEAVRCFFRAASGKGSAQALQSLPQEAGLPPLGINGIVSDAAWRLHYYQWAMQIFEQYNISEGACQFALAALEQVEEAYSSNNQSHDRAALNESVSTIKGSLWAHVCKFTLDLNLFYDAYCAIISNPDEESKYIWLRRLIIVLYERGAIKILCGGQLPFIGLTEKVEQELAWKAERSDILAKPNLYKLLYAFEMHRHNWRKAASYMYLYSARLRTETSLKGYQQLWRSLKEILNGLSAAINALHLVHPAYAWIDPLLERNTLHNEQYPSKKARITIEDQRNDVDLQSWKFYIDIQKIENEFVLTSAEYLLSLAHVKWTNTGTKRAPLELVDLLIQTNLYDMAFTVLLRFSKGSELKRGLERIFSAMSLKCCPHIVDSSRVGDDPTKQGLLLTSSKDEVIVHGSPDMCLSNQQSNGTSQWGTLELYLERYKVFHARLPLIVAETLLRTDSQIELPLWLVKLFKDGKRDKTLGMTGQESNPALLFQLYVDYGRYREATNLLLEYIGSSASMRPANIMNRKRPFGVWFPYTTIQRLWCQLEEMVKSGYMVDQCKQLKDLLHGALLKHLELVKVDSEDALG
ncbi:nuclear pore complex protein NUP160 isoform X2 [Argentina anserina]|uniref:nuclear pore complex protein NUP160 isoform X2 n=1 Tax=Argentina anserina TaxID=57926 RepID=UPI0021769342|nr:nuclear pore complex protein NUP160 isoform X2 [Potentilla anserina]